MKNLKIVKLLATVTCLVLPLFYNSAFARVELFDEEEIMACKAKQRDRVRYSVCLDAELAELERKAKVWENNVELKLQELSQSSGTNNAIIMFNKSAEQFEKFVKQHCQWVYLSMLPNVYNAATLTKECRISEYKNRIERLKAISTKDFYY